MDSSVVLNTTSKIMRTIDCSDKVPGLFLIQNVITPSEESYLVESVNKEVWSGLGIGPNPELKRRTQQYGHLFSYRYRKVVDKYGPLPEFAHFLVERIMENKWMPNTPNHLLVNEYDPGQGIMPHVDAPALFGPAILSLSLLSECIMKFTFEEQHAEIVLPRRSLAVLTGDARYKFKHSISKDLTETTDSGISIERNKRISFTFREIIAWEVVEDGAACGNSS
ncbi:hypothetical protein BD408DRAFT_484212 [Parasitella parasitica]|nr:hypothetical protein BD408DRAFT_484212 [Parasitella parasitica]